MSDTDVNADSNVENAIDADSEIDHGAGDTGDAGTPADTDTTDTDEAERRVRRLDSEQRQGAPYTESQVIMPTVKVVAPFAFTYGLFITFHGSGSPGGGFQGGAIMAAVVFMIAFAFGIEATREWLANTVVVALAVGGALAFAGIGLVPVARGGAFLQYDLLPIPVKYGLESVEIFGIAAIVSGVLMGLFFLLANGFNSDGNEPEGDVGDADDLASDASGEDPPAEAESADGTASVGSDPTPTADGGER